jgi:predicted AAA+ superfamily ATPase
LHGVVVLDEIQERPELFPLLRVLADRRPTKARFVITGSVAPTLRHGLSESLTGRVAWIEMGGFDLEEFGPERWSDLWLRGCFPSSHFAVQDDASLFLRTSADSILVRQEYLQTMLGRDIRILSNLSLEPAEARKLMLLIADTSARAWNHSEAARILGCDSKTVKSYIEVLKAAFLVRELPVMEANIRKRLRKTPALHLRDTGLLHLLLGIHSQRQLEEHPRMGSSWETFCVDQIVRMTETKSESCFTFSIQSGIEIDLILDRPEGKIGFEIKSSEKTFPREPEIEIVEQLELKSLYYVRRGTGRYALSERVWSVGIEELPSVCREIRQNANSHPAD